MGHSGLWQASEESESAAGRLQDAAAASDALQAQLQDLQAQQEANSGSPHAEQALALISAEDADSLLEELESLVQQLDQQEASKKQALDRAEAAERDLEALKLKQSSLGEEPKAKQDFGGPGSPSSEPARQEVDVADAVSLAAAQERVQQLEAENKQLRQAASKRSKALAQARHFIDSNLQRSSAVLQGTAEIQGNGVQARSAQSSEAGDHANK